jgi:hypothetical protein
MIYMPKTDSKDTNQTTKESSDLNIQSKNGPFS